MNKTLPVQNTGTHLSLGCRDTHRKDGRAGEARHFSLFGTSVQVRCRRSLWISVSSSHLSETEVRKCVRRISLLLFSHKWSHPPFLFLLFLSFFSLSRTFLPALIRLHLSLFLVHLHHSILALSLLYYLPLSSISNT